MYSHRALIGKRNTKNMSENIKIMSKRELENLALEFGWDAEGGEDAMDAMTKQDWLDWLNANTEIIDGYRQNR